MATLPKIPPFEISEVISSNSFYTNYSATATHLEGNVNFIVTEFNPVYMVDRAEDGVLDPKERFLMEFETALETFINRGEALDSLGEPFIAPIEELIRANNTAYVVRQVDRYTFLEEGLSGKSMDFHEAYQFMRPLIQSLVMASGRGLYFQYEPGDFTLTTYGQLMIDSMFIWEGDFNETLVALAKLYYRLIAGVPYSPEVPENPKMIDIMPTRLAAIMEEALTGDTAFGSIDNFNKEVRTAIDSDPRKATPTTEKPLLQHSSEPTERLKKRTAVAILAGLAVCIVGLMSIPIVLLRGASTEEIADQAYYQYMYALLDALDETYVPEGEFVRIHSAHAVTDPQNPTDMLNGSFLYHNGQKFMRIYQEGYGLARQGPDGSVTMLASNVRPTFITYHGGFVYFSDGLSGYNIRRVRADGSGELRTISDDMASFLQISGEFLFYTNHSSEDFMYRMDLNTLAGSRFLSVPAYETLIYRGGIYFINGADGFRVNSVPAGQPETEPERLNDANSDNLRIGSDIFYRNLSDNSINRIRGGVSSRVAYGMPVESFDIYGETLAIIAEGTNRLLFYHTASSSSQDTGYRAAYAASVPGGALIIDFNNTSLTRLVESPEILPIEPEDDEEDIEESENI